MGLQEIVGTAVGTELSADMTPASTSFTVVDASGWPTGGGGNPFVVTIGKGTASEEKILCTSRTGTTIAVTTRGYDGTTAADHQTGNEVIHSISAVLLAEMNAHVNDDARDDHSQYLPAASSVAGAGLDVAARVLSVEPHGITNAMRAQMATMRIKGNNTGGTADEADLTVAQVLTMLSLDSTDLSDFIEAVQDTIGAFSGFGGSGLTFTYDDAGNALTLAVNVDGTTLEINADTLRVKAGFAYGELDRFDVTANQMIANTSGAFSSTLTKTFVVPTGRKCVVVVDVLGSSSLAGDTIEIRLKQAGTIINRRSLTVESNNGVLPVYFETRTTATGSVVFLVEISRLFGSGTGGFVATATELASLVLIDRGAV